ncbi:hypothetical protein [Sorangium sp. So ce861]|uniref:hypothetical protein n=1 Tax=Sorangium sp. So ce861 TaxID=3133323 RepID=UPI003F5DB1C7
MSAVQIIRVPILPFRMVNVHLLVGAAGCVLVDAGVPGAAPKVGEALARAGRGWSDLKLMLGGLARLGHAIRPPFELDPRAVGVELERLVDEGVQTFHLGHGGPLGAGSSWAKGREPRAAMFCGADVRRRFRPGSSTGRATSLLGLITVVLCQHEARAIQGHGSGTDLGSRGGAQAPRTGAGVHLGMGCRR